VIARFLREIRIEHTLFALPFAYVGALFAAHGFPSWHALLWITLAVVGARTAAMAANRYFDRDIDARNPRTARRALAAGKLSPALMLWAVVLGVLLLAVSALMLNPLCFKLLPIAAAGVLLYPLCKRFTWSTHFVLGAVDALAPIGAFVAVAGTVRVPAVLLFLAVMLWVAGFDIIYALMDYAVDRQQGLASIPARFGQLAARRVPFALHTAMVLALAWAGYVAAASGWYFVGIVAAGALMVYEIAQMRAAANLFVLNERIFVANMAFSLIFLGTTWAGFTLR